VRYGFFICFRQDYFAIFICEVFKWWLITTLAAFAFVTLLPYPSRVRDSVSSIMQIAKRKGIYVALEYKI
jgi:hypothetical protein